MRAGECTGLLLQRGKLCRPNQVRRRPLRNCDLPGLPPEWAPGGKSGRLWSVPGTQPAAPHRHAHVPAISQAAGRQIPLRLPRIQFRQRSAGE